MKVLYFAFCFAIAAFAGWVTNLSYQASIIEMNESIAHSEIGMAVCLALMSLTWLAMPILVSPRQMRLTLC